MLKPNFLGTTCKVLCHSDFIYQSSCFSSQCQDSTHYPKSVSIFHRVILWHWLFSLPNSCVTAFFPEFLLTIPKVKMLMPHEGFFVPQVPCICTLHMPPSSTCVALSHNHGFLSTMSSYGRQTNLTIPKFSGTFKVPDTW